MQQVKKSEPCVIENRVYDDHDEKSNHDDDDDDDVVL